MSSAHDYRQFLLPRQPVSRRRKFISQFRYHILLLVVIVITLAIVIPVTRSQKLKDPNAPNTSGVNLNDQARNRSIWTGSFDINTDWERSWPKTGITRTYTFNVTEIDQFNGGDGVMKQKAMLINGQFPGPVIRANWGDTIHVTVFNNLRANGTSIHWHGFRQHNNNINDGASGVTECPIPPGHRKTYSFQATQYGTSWYHSHVSSQYANGISGAIQIDGPASCEYDIDLGVFPISDWYYDTADDLLSRVFDPLNPFTVGIPGSPPPSDNILFNGTNVDPYGFGSGSYAKVIFKQGKRHRLRLINTSTDNTFTISIVGHSMTIIATDFVPVHPYPVESVYMTVGQRFDVVIDANQPVGTYWLNATFSKTGVCGFSINPYPAAIVQYEGAPWLEPEDQGFPPEDTHCADDISPVPVVPRIPPSVSFNFNPLNPLNVSLAVNTTVSRVYWEVNGRAINVDWGKPTLQYVINGSDPFPSDSNIISIPNKTQWTLWLIQNVSPIPHPIHLHGHDFIILGRSPALPNPLDPASLLTPFNAATDSRELLHGLTLLRRDTTVLPALGWLAVGFEATNPGAWLFHCHIAWHASQGLSVQFLERPEDISKLMNVAGALNQTCPQWKNYEKVNPWPKIDSGV